MTKPYQPHELLKIFCIECDKEVEAYLTDGSEIYPHREDLAWLPFWKCRNCKNYVGCHHKTANPIKPLGVIPSRMLRLKRKEIHSLLDPIWRNKIASRKSVYKYLSKKLGREYHTAEIKTEKEAEEIIELLKGYAKTQQKLLKD